jgi:hypothetical protein
VPRATQGNSLEIHRMNMKVDIIPYKTHSSKIQADNNARFSSMPVKEKRELEPILEGKRNA